MCDFFFTLAQAPGRAVVLPDAARRELPRPAPEGQARRPCTRVVRGRVPRLPRVDDRRGGPRRPDDRRAGQLHAPRHDHGHGRGPPAGGRRGDPSRPPPPRLRPRARRPAADAERARGSRARERGDDDGGDAARARLRGPGAVGVSAACDRGREVLGHEARGPRRGRGARVPRGQRLRRGVDDAAALPRHRAELRLGGRRQRRGARRAAGDGEGTRCAAGVHRGVRPRAGRERSLRRAHGGAARKGSVPVSCAADRRGPGGRAPGQPSRPARPARGVGRLLREPAGPRIEGHAYGTLPQPRTQRGSWSEHGDSRPSNEQRQRQRPTRSSTNPRRSSPTTSSRRTPRFRRRSIAKTPAGGSTACATSARSPAAPRRATTPTAASATSRAS